MAEASNKNEEGQAKTRREGTVHQKPSIEEIFPKMKLTEKLIPVGNEDRRMSEPCWKTVQQQIDSANVKSRWNSRWRSAPEEEYSLQKLMKLYDDPVSAWNALLKNAEGSVLRGRSFDDTFRWVFRFAQKRRCNHKSIEEEANENRKKGNFIRSFILLVWSSELYCKYCGPKLELELSCKCLQELKCVALQMIKKEKMQGSKLALHTEVILPSMYKIVQRLENVSISKSEFKVKIVVDSYNCISQYCKEFGDFVAAKATYKQCKQFVGKQEPK